MITHSKQEDMLKHVDQEYGEDEIDILALLNVLWEQRFFITAITLIFVFLGIIYSFIRTPLFEINAQISPGITDFDKNGNAVRNLTRNDIISWFSEKAYYEVFGDERTQCPKIIAQKVPNSNLINIKYYCKMPEKGMEVIRMTLSSLEDGGAKHLKTELKVARIGIKQKIHAEEQTIEKLNIERDLIHNIERVKIDNEIKDTENKIKLLRKKIETIKINKIQTQEAIELTRKKIDSINKNSDEIISLRKQLISEGSNKMALLMYSNIIQQNISYANNLQRQFFDFRKKINMYIDEEEDLRNRAENLQIDVWELKLKRDKVLAMKEQKLIIDIEKTKKEIDTLDMKLSSLSIIELIKPPISSPHPTKPEKSRIIFLVSILGFAASVILSFLRKYWMNNRRRLAEE